MGLPEATPVTGLTVPFLVMRSRSNTFHHTSHHKKGNHQPRHPVSAWSSVTMGVSRSRPMTCCDDERGGSSEARERGASMTAAHSSTAAGAKPAYVIEVALVLSGAPCAATVADLHRKIGIQLLATSSPTPSKKNTSCLNYSTPLHLHLHSVHITRQGRPSNDRRC